MVEPTEITFVEWCILELMGHVRLGGKVTEENLFGTKMGRIDVPGKDGAFTTQYFAGSAVYRLTPTTEGIARAVAASSQPEPVHRWELPQLEATVTGPAHHVGYNEDEDVDEEESEPDDGSLVH